MVCYRVEMRAGHLYCSANWHAALAEASSWEGVFGFAASHSLKQSPLNTESSSLSRTFNLVLGIKLQLYSETHQRIA